MFWHHGKWLQICQLDVNKEQNGLWAEPSEITDADNAVALAISTYFALRQTKRFIAFIYERKHINDGYKNDSMAELWTIAAKKTYTNRPRTRSWQPNAIHWSNLFELFQDASFLLLEFLHSIQHNTSLECEECSSLFHIDRSNTI